MALHQPPHVQWCSFNLTDIDKQKALIAQGAYTARSGALVGIWVSAHTAPPEIERDGQDAVSVDTVPLDAAPGDTVPGDTVPGDTVPDDAVPGDAVPEMVKLVRQSGADLDFVDAFGIIHRSVAFAMNEITDFVLVLDPRDLPLGSGTNAGAGSQANAG